MTSLLISFYGTQSVFILVFLLAELLFLGKCIIFKSDLVPRYNELIPCYDAADRSGCV